MLAEEKEKKTFIPERAVDTRTTSVVGGQLVRLTVHLSHLVGSSLALCTAVGGVASDPCSQVVTHLLSICLILCCDATEDERVSVHFYGMDAIEPEVGASNTYGAIPKPLSVDWSL